MIKKILLLLTIVVLVMSCGKKSDPTYKSSKHEIYKTFII